MPNIMLYESDFAPIPYPSFRLSLDATYAALLRIGAKDAKFCKRVRACINGTSTAQRPRKKGYQHKEAREAEIVNYLEEYGELSAQLVADMLGADYRTASRFLLAMYRDGILTRRKEAAVWVYAVDTAQRRKTA